jgi:predicted esterase/catechol 2,3-dioxygenase-like lactoylglutathione lyase family enzyme
MSIRFRGIHHVTAIASDPQRNLDFWSGLLGLRLVKRTVNFDDPGTYHLYYGDAAGNPGTIMTFFTWPGAPRGGAGAGQVVATAFSIPEGSLGYWTGRLVEHGVRFDRPRQRFGETFLSFSDPDGIGAELVARPRRDGDFEAWDGSPVPAEHAIRGVAGITIISADRDATTDLLTEVLGFEAAGEEDGRPRYLAAGPGSSFVDVLDGAGWPPGDTAVGTVHHVAWRAPDEETQASWRGELEGRGLNVTPVLDRNYFRSIYFREPGNVLYEIATDPPGFDADERADHLGESLKLPPWLEDDRTSIEATLPPLHLPGQRPDTARTPLDDFAHRFVPAEGGDTTTFLLLHGTGGDEDDLLPLGRALSPTAALLSPRGKVLENGMPRFFRRLAEGVFDEEDLKNRTDELAGFVRAAVNKYGLDPHHTYAVGFSNGANIAASLLLAYPDLLAGAVLLRAMVPFEPETPPDLSGVHVYLAAGRQDQMVPPENTEKLAQLLRNSGADVTLDWQPGGHGIGPVEVEAARRWFEGMAQGARRQ